MLFQIGASHPSPILTLERIKRAVSLVTFDEELFEPVCMASIIKVSTKENGGVSRLLFVNPDSRNIPKNPRENLTAKLSYYEGKNWTVQKVLNPGSSGYSDLAVGRDGTIYCLYETNTISKGGIIVLY